MKKCSTKKYLLAIVLSSFLALFCTKSNKAASTKNLNKLYQNQNNELRQNDEDIITLFDEIPYLWPYKGIEHIKLEGNKVIIVTPYSLEQLRHGYVWYGAGPNTICTIQDAEGRAPLAMGPVPIVSALG